jgi:CRP-like cAMP-binding protein
MNTWNVTGKKQAIPPFDINAFVAKYGGLTGKKIAKGQAIYSQGEPANCVFYVEKGQAQLTVISRQGKEAIISSVEAGEFCGEECLAGEPLRISNAATTAGCSVARLEKVDVIRALHDDMPFAEFFVIYTLNQTLRCVTI